MNKGGSLFSQIMNYVSHNEFNRCVGRYEGNKWSKNFSCWDQFLCMAFAQLTFRESLRDIETCLRSQGSKLYHLGIRGSVSRSTLAYANDNRDWRIYADLAQLLITEARRLYANDDFDVDLANTVYALDSTTIDLCLELFPWAKFRTTKAGIKLHTLLDLRGSIPSFISMQKRHLTFLTNDFSLPPDIIAQLYKACWRVELFFKWIKQHLRIKAFFGTSDNAVRTQIWIVVSVMYSWQS